MKELPANLLTRKAICSITGLSTSTLYKITMEKHAFFPKPKSRIDRTDLYDEKEVKEWLKNNDPKKLSIDNDNFNGHKPTLNNYMAQKFIRGKL